MALQASALAPFPCPRRASYPGNSAGVPICGPCLTHRQTAFGRSFAVYIALTQLRAGICSARLFPVPLAIGFCDRAVGGARIFPGVTSFDSSLSIASPARASGLIFQRQKAISGQVELHNRANGRTPLKRAALRGLPDCRAEKDRLVGRSHR
jgi:hypothetical protein